jgi:intein-encoded DNA endonuclease-like protein
MTFVLDRENNFDLEAYNYIIDRKTIFTDLEDLIANDYKKLSFIL